MSARLNEHSAAYRIYSLNPMAKFVASFRDTVYDGRMPDLGTLGYLTGVTALVLVCGHVLFRMVEGSLAEEL